MQHASLMGLAPGQMQAYARRLGARPVPAATDDAGDELRPARGIVNGLLIAVVLWALLRWVLAQLL